MNLYYDVETMRGLKHLFLVGVTAIVGLVDVEVMIRAVAVGAKGLVKSTSKTARN